MTPHFVLVRAGYSDGGARLISAEPARNDRRDGCIPRVASGSFRHQANARSQGLIGWSHDSEFLKEPSNRPAKRPNRLLATPGRAAAGRIGPSRLVACPAPFD